MSWAVIGSLVKITIGNPENDPDDSCLYPILEEGCSEKNNASASHQVTDTLTGRIYNYDFSTKILILKTVERPGRVDEFFTDSVIINSRNILQFEHYKDYEKPLKLQKELTESEIKQQFTVGEIDRFDRDKMQEKLEQAIKERRAMLEAKKIELGI